MSEQKHTLGAWAVAPRPWSFDFVRGQAAIVDANGQPVAFVSSTRGKFEPEKVNAEHAAKCVNAHDDLLALLQQWATLDAGDWHAVRHANEKARLLDDTCAAIARAAGA